MGEGDFKFKETVGINFGVNMATAGVGNKVKHAGKAAKLAVKIGTNFTGQYVQAKYIEGLQTDEALVSAVIGTIAGEAFERSARVGYKSLKKGFGKQMDSATKLVGEAVDGVGAWVNKIADNAMQSGPGRINRETGALLPEPITLKGLRSKTPYNQASGQGVYILKDPFSGEVKYIGRGDVKARGIVHNNSSDKGHLVQEVIHNNNLNKPQAKFIEQKLMDEFGGALSTNPATNLLNKNRSYTQKNPNAEKYNIAGESSVAAESLWLRTMKQIKKEN